MLKKEFIERTNLQVTDEEYNKIDFMYCEAGNMDKDVFCADYKKHKDSKLIQEFSFLATTRKIRVNQLEEQLKSLGYFLADQAEEETSTALRNKAINVLGLREYLSYKVSKNYELWDEDKAALIDFLNANR